jgi:pyruvate kinase
MVARGDLGVEMPAEQVPAIQKRIVRACRRLGKPVIVATQMLESMIAAPVPTRAEASDVATAIYDGADAVMLSAESASGRFPVESVAMMARIIAQTEADPHYRNALDASHTPPSANTADAIGHAAHAVAGLLDVAAMVAYTSSGASALRMARERPRASILGLTPNPATARRLTLVWGVHAVVTKDASDADDMASRACKFAVRENFAIARYRGGVIATVPRVDDTFLYHAFLCYAQADAPFIRSTLLPRTALDLEGNGKTLEFPNLESSDAAPGG